MICDETFILNTLAIELEKLVKRLEKNQTNMMKRFLYFDAGKH